MLAYSLPLLRSEAEVIARSAFDDFARASLAGFLTCVVLVDLETGKYECNGFFSPASAHEYARRQERLAERGALAFAAFTFVCGAIVPAPAADRA